MCDTNNSLNPRERLASKIQLRTNDGDDILHYLFEVFYEIPTGVAHGHRVQVARILIRYGHLSPFALVKLQELSPAESRKADCDAERFDARLARTIRNMTGDGEDIVNYLLNTMNGIDDSSKKRICHNSRLAAARELLSRGYPPECDCAHRAASETEVVRSAATSSEPTTESVEPTADRAEDSEEEANIELILEKIRRIAEETDPSEYEEDESSDHKPNYSMWDYIDSLPEPELTEEQARIGAARFHEAVERQRRWRESGAEIPRRSDRNTYEDG